MSAIRTSLNLNSSIFSRLSRNKSPRRVCSPTLTAQIVNVFFLNIFYLKFFLYHMLITRAEDCTHFETPRKCKKWGLGRGPKSKNGEGVAPTPPPQRPRPQSLFVPTEAHDTHSRNRRNESTPISGTCVMQIWDRIRLVPDFGADQNTVLFQARKWRARDLNGPLWCIPFQLFFVYNNGGRLGEFIIYV